MLRSCETPYRFMVRQTVHSSYRHQVWNRNCWRARCWTHHLGRFSRNWIVRSLRWLAIREIPVLGEKDHDLTALQSEIISKKWTFTFRILVWLVIHSQPCSDSVKSGFADESLNCADIRTMANVNPEKQSSRREKTFAKQSSINKLRSFYFREHLLLYAISSDVRLERIAKPWNSG
jgi:hypothetical protein